MRMQKHRAVTSISLTLHEPLHFQLQGSVEGVEGSVPTAQLWLLCSVVESMYFKARTRRVILTLHERVGWLSLI